MFAIVPLIEDAIRIVGGSLRIRELAQAKSKAADAY
jgi:hypothetical protein